MGRIALALLALACVSGAVARESLYKDTFQPGDGATRMSTNIAVLSSKDELGKLRMGQNNLAIVDPTDMVSHLVQGKRDGGDDLEDPRDPFITTSSGKRRPDLLRTAAEWAEEEPSAKLRKRTQEPAKALSRKKRCGDNGGGGGGNARRSRRSRRARRTRRTRTNAPGGSTKTSTTTVTRKVIQNGQVVSQTTETKKPGQVTVQQQPAVVQSVAPQPMVVQQQQPQPVVVQQPAATGVPSIAVTGSVKVN